MNISKKIALYCTLNNTKLIFTSSSAIYAPSKLPVKENGKIDPMTNYGKAKYKIEQFFTKINTENYFPLFILRLFNPYGPYQNKMFVINQIIEALLNKTALKIQIQ